MTMITKRETRIAAELRKALLLDLAGIECSDKKLLHITKGTFLRFRVELKMAIGNVMKSIYGGGTS